MLFLSDDYVLAKKKPKMYRVLKGCYEMENNIQEPTS